jgi:cobalt-zinc-cadmium efflux system outer membrane protein
LPRGLAAQAAQAPVTLDGALARFHAGSPALSLARNRLRAERASSRQGAALPNPTAAFSHEDLGVYSERYLTLSQRVDFLWDAPGRGRRADARALRATARFQADSAALVLELKEAYVATWEAGDRVSVLARADEVVASLLADARARLAEGDLAGYDVRRLEVERARVGRQLAEAVVEQELARAHLAALLGGEGITAAGVQELEGAPPPLTESFDAVATALARRPELDAVRAGVDEQRAEASLARSSLLAGTSVEAGVKRQSDGQNGLFLGVQLPLPVLDRKGSAIEGARAAVAGAESEAALVEAMVAVEATRARARLDAAARITELVGERGLAEAETLLAIARVAYGEGEIGIVEVVDAAQTFTEAALQGVRARVAAWSAYFELEKAVGGLRDVMHQGDGR